MPNRQGKYRKGEFEEEKDKKKGPWAVPWAKMAAKNAFATNSQRRRSQLDRGKESEPVDGAVQFPRRNEHMSTIHQHTYMRESQPESLEPIYYPTYDSNIERQHSFKSMGDARADGTRLNFEDSDDLRRSDLRDLPDPGMLNIRVAHTRPSELADIEKYVLRAKFELPELQGPKDESTEDAVIRIVQTYKRISESLRDSRGRLELVDKIKEKYQKTQAELELTKQEGENWKIHYQAEINSLKASVQTLQMGASEATRLSTEVLSLQHQKEEMETRYEKLLNDAHEDARMQMNELEKQKYSLQEHFRQRDQREYEHAQQLQAVQAKHEAQIEDLNVKFGHRVKETSGMFERHIGHLQQQNAENITQLREAEAQIRTMKQELEQLNLKHEEEIAEMKDTKKMDTEDLKRELEIVKLELSKSESHGAESLEKEREALRQAMSNSQAGLAEEREKQQAMMQDVRRKHNAESNRQRAEAEMRMKKELMKYEDMVRRLKTQHKSELDRQVIEADSRSKKQQRRYEVEVREMKAAILELAELKADVQQQIPRLQLDVSSLKSQLGDDSGANIRQVRAAAENLRTTLSSQHYQGLKDHQIVARFRKIASEIERFARVEWDSRRAAHWPCTEDNLVHLNRENTRKLQQYIVQSSLWMFLFERIFRSPFCMFGHEGAEMDRDWEDIYSPNTFPSKWPDIPLDVEDTRSTTAKRCLALIDPSTEPAPDDVKLKNSYELVVATTVEAFSGIIENVTPFRESGRNTVTAIVRLCAEVWLECCSQQYRLMVRVGATSGNVLHLSPREMSTLALLRVPDLKRYGNHQGVNLKKEEAVVGWKSVVTVFPAP